MGTEFYILFNLSIHVATDYHIRQYSNRISLNLTYMSSMALKVPSLFKNKIDLNIVNFKRSLNIDVMVDTCLTFWSILNL